MGLRHLIRYHVPGCDIPEKNSLKKARALETMQAIDRKKTSCDQKQEHVIEPGHFYGIGR